jgi:hypothetical protein
MTNRIILLCLYVLTASCLSAQGFSIRALEDHTLEVEFNSDLWLPSQRSSSQEQMTGFPIGFQANSTFKNFRNVTLEDLDGDGIPEILFGINMTLYAYSGDSLLWQKGLQGLAIYPPSTGDLDGDGDIEIVQVTGGAGEPGRVYALNHSGEDLTGWPLDFDDHWILAAPVLSDVDGDGEREIIVNERDVPAGNVHILRLDGSSFSSNWPVRLDRTPAVTPSVADVNGDGLKEIVAFSTESRYIFDLQGQVLPSFPQTTHPQQRYSFQSPILVDMTGDGTLEIVGATHTTPNPGEGLPLFFAMEHTGEYLDGWPMAVPQRSWTYSTPTVVSNPAGLHIIMSKPIGEQPNEMLFAWDQSGDLYPGFPIVKPGGLEGVISVADVDGDDVMELIFGSNVVDSSGFGFIHAYELNGGGELAGFPWRTRGWTYMNGPAIGDINGDGWMDIVALSYTQTFSSVPDSTFLNVFELTVPYDPTRVKWGTYKGSNTREGVVRTDVSTGTSHTATQDDIVLYPMPAGDRLYVEGIRCDTPGAFVLQDLAGRTIDAARVLSGDKCSIELRDVPPGLYWLMGETGGRRWVKKVVRHSHK